MSTRSVALGRRRTGVARGLALAAAGLLLVLAAPATSAVAAPPFLWQSPEHGALGSGAGEFNVPRGVAVAPATAPNRGHVFVGDQENGRVVEFDPWGRFVRAWGWDVVASGPDDDTTPPEDQFEVCTAVDVCKNGILGSGAGQFGSFAPQGLAVDSSGDVYVVDRPNRRIEKFGPEGHFLLMFGGKVNKTKFEAAAPEAQQNVCPVDPDDVCQAGLQGSGDGQFGEWAIGSYIAVGPGDRVYVGDVGRIQYFSSDGQYQGKITAGIASAEKVKSLAVGPSGVVYAAIEGQGGVRRWSAYPNHESLSAVPVGGEPPLALAVDRDENLYVVNGSETPLIRKLGPGGGEVESWGQGTSPSPMLGKNTTGLAVGSGCLNEGEGSDVYVASSGQGGADGLVRAYGPPPDFSLPPDSGLCEPPPARAPAIEEQQALTVGTASATLGASINPLFWPDARYYVQYGTGKCSEGGCGSELPAPPGLLLTANTVSESVATAGIFLGDLEPGTTYHYRFVAQSSGGGPVFGVDPDGEGPEEASAAAGLEGTFTTFAAPAPPPACANDAFRRGLPGERLPDCRAYELVSPADKNGADAIAPDNVGELPSEEAQFRASSDGEKVSYASTVAFADAKAGPFSVGYVASRSGAGWSTQGILPPQGTNIDINTPAYAWNHVLDLSVDLDSTWLYADSDPPPAGGVPGYRNLYRCENATVSCEALTKVKPPSWAAGEQAYKQWLDGHSADGQVSVYSANDHLTGDASSATVGGKPIFQTYEQRAGQPGPTLVSRLPGGGASAQPSFAGGGIESLEGAVSADGARIYWTTGPLPPGPPFTSVLEGGSISGRIYLHVDGTETIPVSPESQAARFWVGAENGSAALYTVGGALYRFDLATESSTQIAASGVLGVGGAADDLSRAYFVSTAVLDPVPNSAGDSAALGRENLYLYTQGGGIRFVATPDRGTVGSVWRASVYADGQVLANRLENVTPDGKTFVFAAYNPLTHVDNTVDGNRYMQVFRYSADGDRLDCISCNPTGAQLLGSEEVRRRPFISAQIPGWRQGPYHEQRAVGDDGDRVYFESYDRLTPADTDGRLDVYQWQAPGSGECTTAKVSYSPVSGGCVELISTGESDADSQFIEATPDGSTVFLRTAERLVPLDRDNLYDVYAARTLGGLAAQHPAPPPGPCEGEGCRGSGPAAPPALGAGSAGLQGAGNVTAAKPKKSCAKGKVRKARKCVKKQARHKHRRHAAKRNRRAAR